MDSKKCGHLSIFCGPMWSSKSTELAAKISKYADLGMKCLFINHAFDDRTDSKDTVDDGNFSRHGTSSFQLSSKICKIKTPNLSLLDVSEYDAIAIDECQFFDMDLLEEVPLWVNIHHKVVLCAGLDGDAECNKFGYLLDLIPYADKVQKLRAKCTVCLEELRKTDFRGIGAIKAKAPFSARIVETSLTSQVQVGGSESYTSMCRYHHQQHLQSS